ncbi:MAG: HAMP domain-containing histidine kinase [Bacteroidales bacterium]|nr:HAMP domain-containing histidine kinase [Bacteroidales bacterium]
MDTKFAPAERASEERLLSGKKSIESIRQFSNLLNSLPFVAAILNEFRQIIYSNEVLLETLGNITIDDILGKRPGEVLSCIHAFKEPGGCGTAEHCRVCGAIRAVMESQEYNKKVIHECRITSLINNEEISADYLVSATPFHWKDHKYTIITLSDISHEKRRKALEKVFFHDIINKAGSLSGLIDMLKDIKDNRKIKDYLRLARILSDELTEEILAQRSLLAAESGELELEFNQVRSRNLIQDNVDQIMNHYVAVNRQIEIDPDAVNIEFKTDPILLNRILTNMLKNALEATPEKEKILVGCDSHDSKVVFWVHNNRVMPEEVKLQVFQRSFSTKGSNRGLGTYSIKLLGERYLKGKVWFKSEENFGTRFYLGLPLT